VIVCCLHTVLETNELTCLTIGCGFGRPVPDPVIPGARPVAVGANSNKNSCVWYVCVSVCVCV